MIYISSFGIAAVMVTLMTVFMIKSGYYVLDESKLISQPASEISETDDNNEESGAKTEKAEDDKSMAFYSKPHALMLTAGIFIVSVLVNFLLYKYTADNSEPLYTLFVKMAITHVLTACAALTDAKRSKIPNPIIVFGLAARGVIYIAEFLFFNETFTATLKNDALGFLIGFVMLFVISVISKGGIGYGDIKLFGVIGLMAGSAGVFLTLLLSLLLSSVTALALMAMHKKTIKSAMPMAPFIYLGFLTISVLGIF